jgi:hypothetical protein
VMFIQFYEKRSKSIHICRSGSSDYH